MQAKLDLSERRGRRSIQNRIDIIECHHTHVGPALNRRRSDMRQQKCVLKPNIRRVDFWLSFVDVQTCCSDPAGF